MVATAPVSSSASSSRGSAGSIKKQSQQCAPPDGDGTIVLGWTNSCVDDDQDGPPDCKSDYVAEQKGDAVPKLSSERRLSQVVTSYIRRPSNAQQLQASARTASRKVLDAADANGDGTIDAKEFEEVYKLMRRAISEEQTQKRASRSTTAEAQRRSKQLATIAGVLVLFVALLLGGNGALMYVVVENAKSTKVESVSEGQTELRSMSGAHAASTCATQTSTHAPHSTSWTRLTACRPTLRPRRRPRCYWRRCLVRLPL